jgi:thiol-disulfide isomerase/thioredoxin
MLLAKHQMTTAFLVTLLVGAVATSLAHYSIAAQQSAAKGSAAPASSADAQNIRGSGKVVTKDQSVADFTMVEVSRSFRVEITRGDSFRVAITADENLFPFIKAIKDGSTLRLSLDIQSFSASALKATIAMPALQGLSLARGSKATCKGFKSAKVFQAKLTGSSTLEGEIEAEKVDVDAAGGSQVTLKGSAKTAKVSATQECLLFLNELALDEADVTLKHGSKAAVNVKQRLDYDLSAASRLEYRVAPARSKGRTTDGSLALTSTTPGEGWAKAKSSASHHHHGAAHSHGNDAGSRVQASVGKAVPDFALRDLNGKKLKFSDLQKEGKRTQKGVVVLSIWCSTCGSCRRVEHDLDKLAKDYEGKALVIALDVNAGETPEIVKAFAKEMGLTLPIFLNPDGAAADILGTEVTTTTAVIDGDGVLRYCGRFSAGDKHAYAEEALKAVLAGKEVAVKTTQHDG